MSLSRLIKSSFDSLDEVSRKWIHVKCLDVVAGATVRPGSREDEVLRQRLARGGEPAAIRATGIRKAMFDPQLAAYYEKIDDHVAAVSAQLLPRY